MLLWYFEQKLTYLYFQYFYTFVYSFHDSLLVVMLEKYCREILDTYTGSFPQVRIKSDCRCSASKPRIHPQTTTMCVNNSVAVDRGATTRMTMNNTSDTWRLDVNSHPLEYVNDGDVNSFWVSTALQQISLTITFGDIFQVIANGFVRFKFWFQAKAMLLRDLENTLHRKSIH